MPIGLFHRSRDCAILVNMTPKSRLTVFILGSLLSGCGFIHRPVELWPDDIDIEVDIPIFPPSSAWNTDIAGYPVHGNSANLIGSIGNDTGLHADFGTVWNGAPNGIPFTVVNGGQAKMKIVFSYDEESDPGPYPIPDNAPIEGGPYAAGDRHVIVIDRDNHLLYELFAAYPHHAYWTAGSGAVWDLNGIDRQRELGWTSADAAGLPIFPGLVRYDEAASGEIKHALRFTVNDTRRAFIAPASHYASNSDDVNLPPMGLRVRLKAAFDISSFSPMNQAILTAMKKYGMIVADNGADWFVSGAPDRRWDDDDLHDLGRVHGGDFEAVDTGPIELPPP